MKSFFQELFQYNNHFNQKLISALNENPDKVSEKSIKIMSHILNAHKIWNSKIQPGPVPSGSWEIQPPSDFQEMDKKNFERSTLLVETVGLDQVIQYSTSAGKIFNHRVQDILFQIINHSTYHRGQIAADFRQNGMEPLLTDYIYYKM